MSDDLGDYVAVLGPLVILFGLLALVIHSRALKRMQDRAVDRRVGPGQGALLRRALEDGVIPPGADVAAWRAEMAKTRVSTSRSGRVYFVVIALLALFLMFDAGTPDNIDEALLKLTPALIIIAIGVWLFSMIRRVFSQRQRLIRLLNEEE